jgi:hypothetical protein
MGTATKVRNDGRCGHGRGKTRLRNNLDNRTKASKPFDAIAEGVDLGGADRLSAVQRQLVEAFAGAVGRWRWCRQHGRLFAASLAYCEMMVETLTTSALARWRSDPCAFIETALINPETSETYQLLPAERPTLERSASSSSIS